MKSLTRTAYRAIAAFVAAAFVMIGLASPAFADGATWTITNQRTGTVYTDVAIATKEAASGDTLVLGEGNYTLYKVDSAGTTKGKNLTFVGQGTEKTAWNIGAEVPNPDYFGTEYNGDYSFDGAGTVTFKDMTLRSGSADYLGFIRADKTVVDGCVINGKTFYWGYSSAEFKGTTFNAPSGDYALWTYSSPTMTFNGCTFNCAGKAINVYTDYGAGKKDIIVNVNNCTFTSTATGKTALKINDKNMGDFKYKVNITGNTTATGLATDSCTCSKVFGFGGEPYGEKSQNSGRTDVTIDGKTVWTGGKMVNHDYTDGENEKDGFNVTYTKWTSDDAGTWTRTGTPKCRYCGFTKPEFPETAYDLSYDLNGSEDERTAEFAAVTCVTEAEVTAKQPVRKGYSFVGWNTTKDGSGTSYAAGDKFTLSAPVTLYAQWNKDEPTPKPSDTKPADTKPGDKTQTGKKPTGQSLPKTGDNSMIIIGGVAVVAVICIIAGAAVFKGRQE